MKNLLLVLSVFLMASCGSEDNGADKMKQIDQIFSVYNSEDMPGAALMIIQDGEPILQKGYGIANFEQNLPVTSKTNFRLASVTKEFTSMSILQLIEKGQLSLATTLTDIFPDFPAYGQAITIKHLLQHTSGIWDYEDMVPSSQTAQVKDKDVLNYMMGIEKTYFPVGEKYQYSNTAYAVLTQVLEKITGQPFRDYLQANIFVPLEMTNTLAYENGINEVPNRAFGYTIENEEILLTDQSRFSAVLGDGGIYTNLDDLYKWDQALYTEKLISKKYLDMAFSNQRNNAGEVIDYGYGWRIENYKGMDILYHTGSSIGFRTILYRIPANNFTAVILTNRDQGGEFSTLDTVHKVVDLYY